ncbi:hypothetical protein FKM82_021940 [Ascaphus truei]
MPFLLLFLLAVSLLLCKRFYSLQLLQSFYPHFFPPPMFVPIHCTTMYTPSPTTYLPLNNKHTHKSSSHLLSCSIPPYCWGYCFKS